MNANEKQAEALRLADCLDDGNCSLREVLHPAAAELRRLHAENEVMQSEAAEREAEICKLSEVLTFYKSQSNDFSAFCRQHTTRIAELESQIGQYKAARVGFASEFPPDTEGLPDVGNIHKNIRGLKARIAELESQLESIGAGGVGPMVPRAPLPSTEAVIQMARDAAVLGNIESTFNACMHQDHCKAWKAQAGAAPEATASATLTDAQIDAVAEAMPGGLEGFLKGWGWRQFARQVLSAVPQPSEATVGEQEPVAEIWHGTLHWHIPNPAQSLPLELLRGTHYLYTHPQPQRTPLTEAQKAAITRELNRARCLEKRVVGNAELTDRIASAIERARGIGGEA